MPREVKLHSTAGGDGWRAGQKKMSSKWQVELESIILKWRFNVLPIIVISFILSLNSYESLKVKSVVLSQETCSGCQPCREYISLCLSPIWRQTGPQSPLAPTSFSHWVWEDGVQNAMLVPRTGAIYLVVKWVSDSWTCMWSLGKNTGLTSKMFARGSRGPLRPCITVKVFLFEMKFSYT